MGKFILGIAVVALLCGDLVICILALVTFLFAEVIGGDTTTQGNEQQGETPVELD